MYLFLVYRIILNFQANQVWWYTAMSTHHEGGPWMTKVREMLNQTHSFPYHAVLVSLLAKAAEKAFWLSVCGLYHSQELLITDLWELNMSWGHAIAGRDPGLEPQWEATLGEMKSPGLGSSLYHTWNQPALQGGHRQNQGFVEVTQPTLLSA